MLSGGSKAPPVLAVGVLSRGIRLSHAGATIVCLSLGLNSSAISSPTLGFAALAMVG